MTGFFISIQNRFIWQIRRKEYGGEKKTSLKDNKKKSSNLLKLTLFKMCCVYSFFLKKATVCSGNMEKHDIYIYHLKQTVNVIKSSP